MSLAVDAGGSTAASTTATAAPRLGFVGAGWIGRHRMQAVTDGRAGDVVAIADPDPECAAAAIEAAPDAALVGNLDEMVALDLDGIVIATPSALHAVQAQRALEHGVAVFCQKPLSRTAAEAAAVIRTAREQDRLLGVDLSYRHVAGVVAMRETILSGGIGQVFAVDLTFHNAYGPDKAWFRDARLSGGGCVIDLGTHLVDLVLWMLDFPPVADVRSRLYAQGRLLDHLSYGVVEDSAFVEWMLGDATTVRLACSWNLPAGQDAVIEAAFYGTRGSLIVRNIGGSFYDFVVEECHGTSRRTLAGPSGDWGGRAIVAWARRLATAPGFDPAAEHLADVARVVDAIYAR